MPDCGLRLTDTQLSTLRAIKAGKPIERAVTHDRLMQLRLVNTALQLTPAGSAVLDTPMRRKSPRSRFWRKSPNDKRQSDQSG
jgi:hypothetical protein